MDRFHQSRAILYIFLISFCLYLGTYGLLLSGEPTRVPTLQSTGEPRSVLSSISTVENRARCSCSSDGLSGGVNALFLTEENRKYPSLNIATGEEYIFIGCGAHTLYYDESLDQIAGYPWRFCFTHGGQAGQCNTNIWNFGYHVNDYVQARYCSGDYNCGAYTNQMVTSGTLLSTIVFEETNGDGIMNDWPNCCQSCRHAHGCVSWNFDLENMTCELYSAVASVASVNQTYSGPTKFQGTNGSYDDYPLNCVTRNEYDTCDSTIIYLGIAGLVLIILSTAYLYDYCCLYRAIIGRDVCSTYDVTQTPDTFEEVRGVNKHGNAYTTKYRIHNYDVVYKHNNTMYRKPFQERAKFRAHCSLACPDRRTRVFHIVLVPSPPEWGFESEIALLYFESPCGYTYNVINSIYNRSGSMFYGSSNSGVIGFSLTCAFFSYLMAKDGARFVMFYLHPADWDNIAQPKTGDDFNDYNEGLFVLYFLISLVIGIFGNLIVCFFLPPRTLLLLYLCYIKGIGEDNKHGTDQPGESSWQHPNEDQFRKEMGGLIYDGTARDENDDHAEWSEEL